MNKFIKMGFKIIGRTDIFCIMLLWFAFILINGTILQKEIGLTSICEKYFYSNIIWIFNFIPTPGGKLTLIFIFISLTYRLFNDTYLIKKIGLLFIHIGVLILLIGGAITMYFSYEGTILIDQNEKSNLVISKSKYDLILLDKEKNLTYRIHVSKNEKLLHDAFILKIKEINNNTDLNFKFLMDKSKTSFNKYLNLISNLCFIEDENNRLSLIFNITNKGKSKELILIENEIENLVFDINQNTYEIFFRKNERNLPFFIHLIKFEKEIYYGSDFPKSYTSKVLIEDNNRLITYNIKMNKPFKYKGYTFYQTAFIEKRDSLTTILTVTKNYGEIFPYITCILLILGFFLHVLNLYKYLFIRKNV